MFTWKKVKNYAKIRGLNENKYIHMKLNCRKLLQNTQKRYVYETLPTHEQDVPPVVNPNPDTTLDKVKSVIEGSYGQLLTMKGKFDSLLETISKEKYILIPKY